MDWDDYELTCYVSGLRPVANYTINLVYMLSTKPTGASDEWVVDLPLGRCDISNVRLRHVQDPQTLLLAAFY